MPVTEGLGKYIPLEYMSNFLPPCLIKSLIGFRIKYKTNSFLLFNHIPISINRLLNLQCYVTNWLPIQDHCCLTSMIWCFHRDLTKCCLLGETFLKQETLKRFIFLDKSLDKNRAPSENRTHLREYLLGCSTQRKSKSLFNPLYLLIGNICKLIFLSFFVFNGISIFMDY